MIVTCVKQPTGSPPRCRRSRIAVDHQHSPLPLGSSQERPSVNSAPGTVASVAELRASGTCGSETEAGVGQRSASSRRSQARPWLRHERAQGRGPPNWKEAGPLHENPCEFFVSAMAGSVLKVSCWGGYLP